MPADSNDIEPSGAADSAAIAHYRAQGWARLGRVFSEEDLQPLRARATAIMLGEVVIPTLFFQLDSDTGRYEELSYGKGFQGPSLRYRKLEKLEKDPLFRAAIEHPRFARIAHEVIGPAVSLYRAVLFSKSAEGGTLLPWHQDGGTFWGIDRDPILQIWTALDEVPVESGCVEVVPQSHLQGLSRPLGGVIPDDVAIPARAEERAIPLPARAGESILIHNHCWHRSGINRTKKPRRALTICLMDAATRCRRKKGPRSFLRLFENAPKTSS